MKLSVVHSGMFKLDGGAMFGVVPRTMWEKLNPPDEQNLCSWAMRCLLVETDNRKILFDTGIGFKQDAKFRSHFHPHGDQSLLPSLRNQMISPEDITDVFLTHFHFDHVGGALKLDANGGIVPTFPNATYWSNEKHYNWAYDPNPRESASFLKENFVPMKEAGILEMIDVQDKIEWIPGISIHFVYGHTEAMMLPEIRIKGKTFVFAADLFPSVHHLRLPYVMAYDVRPLVTMKEKETMLNRAVEEDLILVFEHDPVNECATVKRDEKGRLGAKRIMTIQEALSE